MDCLILQLATLKLIGHVYYSNHNILQRYVLAFDVQTIYVLKYLIIVAVEQLIYIGLLRIKKCSCSHFVHLHVTRYRS